MTSYQFEAAKNGGVMTRVGRKIAFPERSGAQPKAGETWECDIAGENAAGTVTFLRVLRKCQTVYEYLLDTTSLTLKVGKPWVMSPSDLSEIRAKYPTVGTDDLIQIVTTPCWATWYCSADVHQTYTCEIGNLTIPVRIQNRTPALILDPAIQAAYAGWQQKEQAFMEAWQAWAQDVRAHVRDVVIAQNYIASQETNVDVIYFYTCATCGAPVRVMQTTEERRTVICENDHTIEQDRVIRFMYYEDGRSGAPKRVAEWPVDDFHYVGICTGTNAHQHRIELERFYHSVAYCQQMYDAPSFVASLEHAYWGMPRAIDPTLPILAYIVAVMTVWREREQHHDA